MYHERASNPTSLSHDAGELAHWAVEIFLELILKLGQLNKSHTLKCLIYIQVYIYITY